MFVVFAETWQSYVYKKYTKTALKNILKEKYHSKKILNDLLVGFTKVYEVISPTWESIFDLFENAKYFVESLQMHVYIALKKM